MRDGDEAKVVRAGDSWSTQQLAEYLGVVSACPDASSAIRLGTERAAEALDADAAALLSDGDVVSAVGFPEGRVPDAALRRASTGPSDATLEVGGAGECRILVADLEGEHERRLLLARASQFTREEAALLRGMARVLELTLRTLGALDEERGLREEADRQAGENARLLDTLQERQELTERLARIQRAIVNRARLDDVLDSVVLGAAELLGDEVVGLRLLDPEDSEYVMLASHRGIDPIDVEKVHRSRIGYGAGGRAITERRLLVIDDYGSDPHAMPYFAERHMQTAMAAPVWENGHVIGSLVVASYQRGRRYSAGEQEILAAFAEHASLALTDAKNYDVAVHRAFHDLVTGLPNRALFLDRLEQAVRRSKRTGTASAVLFLDLDGFKNVNDSLGHAAGDQLLIEVSRRLSACLRPADTAARFGGDEFAVLLEDLSGSRDAKLVASRVLAALHEPLALQGRSVTVSASVGIALHTGAGEDLLRNADLAMYRAKSLGKNRYEVYNPAMHAVVVERVRLESELQRAVERGEFELRFQPIVDLENSGLAGVEALVRWQHPERGLLYPGAFIPAAEETRLISPIGRWVLNEACRQGVRWHEMHPHRGRPAVAVNLSVTQLQQAGLIYEVAEALERSGLDPGSLILEITETLLMDDVEVTGTALDGLKQLGVQLAVDDFGTGYSSLQYLQRFPIDILKIAKSFVDGVAEGDPALARAIIDLGQSLDLRVIAEGIELPDQATRLREMGCRWGQGYHFARPLERDGIDALLGGADAALDADGPSLTDHPNVKPALVSGGHGAPHPREAGLLTSGATLTAWPGGDEGSGASSRRAGLRAVPGS